MSQSIFVVAVAVAEFWSGTICQRYRLILKHLVLFLIRFNYSGANISNQMNF